MKQLYFLAFGLLWMATAVRCKFTCDPVIDCSKITITAGDLVPDPLDCQRFYVCVESPSGGPLVPSTSPIQCYQGFHFDHLLIRCVPDLNDHNASCENLCQNICVSECPSPFVNVSVAASKQNCSIYLFCEPVAPLELSCPVDTPYFNGKVCVADQSECCNFCIPYCNRTGIQIQDPCDCRSYFTCIGLGQPSDHVRFTCEIGTYYDELIVGCVPGICTDFCSIDQCR